MERWEVIERYVLLLAGLCLIAGEIWLVFFSSHPIRWVFAALLLPCLFWVFWQALYEDKLNSKEPVVAGERVMHGVYLWARRIVLGAISVLLACLTVYAALQGAVLQALLCAALAFMSGWVAIFGGGVHQSMSDDAAVHRQRMDRYK